jgi:hypothetical protein
MAALSEVSDGAVRDLLDETSGAGGTIVVSVSPLRNRSRTRSAGAGAITFAGRFGARTSEWKPSAAGAPGMGFTALNVSKLATALFEGGSLRLGASTTCCASEEPRETLMV